jgi:hypothetical protein
MPYAMQTRYNIAQTVTKSIMGGDAVFEKGKKAVRHSATTINENAYNRPGYKMQFGIYSADRVGYWA